MNRLTIAAIVGLSLAIPSLSIAASYDVDGKVMQFHTIEKKKKGKAPPGGCYDCRSDGKVLRCYKVPCGPQYPPTK